MEIRQIKIESKNNRLNYICKKCKNKWTKLINEAIKKFPHIYQFCNGDHNKFVLLLRKGVYPYEYIDTQSANIGAQDVPRTFPLQRPQDVP